MAGALIEDFPPPPAPGARLRRARVYDTATHRHALWRWVLPPVVASPRAVLWVMLNPSVAGPVEDDPTIRKVKEYTKRWGYHVAMVGNLFDFISTDPSVLLTNPTATVPTPEGDAELTRMARCAAHIVVAWGVGAEGHEARVRQVLELLDAPVPGRPLYCLGTTKAGHPKHPGRLAYSTPTSVWSPPWR